jgi:hypothetical protein
MKKIAAIVILLFLALPGWAQRTCGTVEYNNSLNNAYPAGKNRDTFEEWIEQKKVELKDRSALQSLTEEQGTVYQIPVVVHIIHNGETEGSGANISFEQIISQIDVLNEDFRRLNADSVNTPSEFVPVAADIGFEFVLAKRDPLGLETNGVTRTQGSQVSWGMSDNSTLKAQSYWSADDYFNIWVAPLSGGLLGWAEFPVTNLLNGLEDATGDALTDGVVVNYRAFGSIDKDPSANLLTDFNLGRTASHEVGHFFGLRHIWGDGNCGVDDYVTDTPTAEDSYFNCPSVGTSTTSCGSQDMFMNYMDYVDDFCMNLFSEGQKERMLVIINNSPRRLSLLTSPGLLPSPVLDLAVTDILSVPDGICDNQVTPEIVVTNVGTSDITAVEIAFSVNGLLAEQQTFTTSLGINESATLLMNTVSLSEFGTLDFTAMAISVNGTTDASSDNDVITKQSIRSATVTALAEDFSTWPDSWSVKSDAPLSSWNTSGAPNLMLTNQAAKLTYYANNSKFTDELITPVLDLSLSNMALFQFRIAYNYREGYDDEIRVLISTDCGNTFSDTLMVLTGREMSTVPNEVQQFTPSGPRDWQTKLLDLNPYSGELVQLKFVGSPQGGNNIYFDDIILLTQPLTDAAVLDLANDAGVICSDLVELGVIVQNQGSETIDALTLELVNEGIPVASEVFTNLALAAGQQSILHLPINFTAGQYNLEMKIMTNDDNLTNNIVSRIITVQSNPELIPLREKFKTLAALETSSWVSSSYYDDISWDVSATENSNFSARYRAFTPGNSGVRSWLVSPLLDFSLTAEASMQFDVSYARNGPALDQLRIWASDNCGTDFNLLLAEFYGTDLSVTTTSSEWTPASAFDWRKLYVNLADLVGMNDVLIGFEMIDSDGNNIFIDNIEFFLSANDSPVEIPVSTVKAYPNPVTQGLVYLTFNLEEKEDVEVLIYNALGSVVGHQRLSGVLNQTYPVEVITTTNGMYYMKVISPSISDTLPLIITN